MIGDVCWTNVSIKLHTIKRVKSGWEYKEGWKNGILVRQTENFRRRQLSNAYYQWKMAKTSVT